VPEPDETRVFLVDDHQMFASSIERVLEDEPGLRVIGTAGSLAEAIDAVVDAAVDVVLVDYALPDSDGPLSVGTFRRTVPGVKIVVLTGLRDETAVAAALEAGCDGYITKDRPPEELVAALHSVMAGATAVSSDLLSGTVVRLRRSQSDQAITRREREVLALLADGVSNAKIAARLHISINTVRNHVQSLLGKLEAHSRLEAVAVAVRRGVLPPPPRPA
jgi:DNA-binding NarL/FixJ family response regulator